MSLLKRMQNDLIMQCRERVANRIARSGYRLSGSSYFSIAVCVFGYELPNPSESEFYENYMRARHFMCDAVEWATLEPPEGWLG